MYCHVDLIFLEHEKLRFIWHALHASETLLTAHCSVSECMELNLDDSYSSMLAECNMPGVCASFSL